jgi:hypothetical protein
MFDELVEKRCGGIEYLRRKIKKLCHELFV